MSEETATPTPVSLPDRSAWLSVVGVLEIILGVLASGMVLLMLLGLVMGAALGSRQAPGLDARSILAGGGIYVLAAVFFIWMGIGTLKGRRWARGIMLAVSWMWLIGGILGGLIFVPNIGHIFDIQAPGAPPMPAAAKTLATVFLAGFFFVFDLLLPGALTYFYSRTDVRDTFKRRDPHPRWTDRCPLPVLVVSLAFGGGALSSVFGVFYGVAPFFGAILTGAPAGALMLLLALALAFLCVQVYRQRPIGWYGALALVTLAGISQVITFLHHDIADLYRAMGYEGEMLQMMEQAARAMTINIPLLTVIFYGLAVIFLIYLRRFFEFPSKPTPAPAESAQATP